MSFAVPWRPSPLRCETPVWEEWWARSLLGTWGTWWWSPATSSAGARPTPSCTWCARCFHSQTWEQKETDTSKYGDEDLLRMFTYMSNRGLRRSSSCWWCVFEQAKPYWSVRPMQNSRYCLKFLWIHHVFNIMNIEGNTALVFRYTNTYALVSKSYLQYVTGNLYSRSSSWQIGQTSSSDISLCLTMGRSPAPPVCSDVLCACCCCCCCCLWRTTAGPRKTSLISISDKPNCHDTARSEHIHAYNMSPRLYLKSNHQTNIQAGAKVWKQSICLCLPMTYLRNNSHIRPWVQIEN